jgi:hypothetical protein
MEDTTLGIAIIITTLIIMVGYFLWAFGPYIGLASWITPTISTWAYRIPVVLAIYGILGVVIWIGYTMATTPPPVPLKNPLDLDRDLGEIIMGDKNEEDKSEEESDLEGEK